MNNKLKYKKVKLPTVKSRAIAYTSKNIHK